MKNTHQDITPKPRLGKLRNMTFFFAVGFAALSSVAILSYVYVHDNDEQGHKVIKVPTKTPKAHAQKNLDHIPLQDDAQDQKDEIRLAQEIENEVEPTPMDEVIDQKVGYEDLVDDKLPLPRAEMIVPKEADIRKQWMTYYGQGAQAELSLDVGRYQVIQADQASGNTYRFSRGVYEYNEETGELSLRHDVSMGAPAPIDGVTYKVLTTNSFKVHVLQDPESGAIYLIGSEDGMKSKNLFPVFLFADYSGAPVLKFEEVIAPLLPESK